LLQINATAIRAAKTHIFFIFTHYSTTKNCLQAAILNLLVIGYLLGGLFVDFGG
jgi:hypothetical protein